MKIITVIDRKKMITIIDKKEIITVIDKMTVGKGVLRSSGCMELPFQRFTR